MTRKPIVLVMALCAALGLLALPAAAHPERDATFPVGDLGVPAYRFDGPTVVVCKPDTPARLQALPPELRARNEALLGDCDFEHINAAIDHIRAEGERGTRILVQPGIYREEPYVGAIDEGCMEVGTPPGGEGTIDVGAIPLPPQDDPRQDEGNNEPGSLVLTYEEQLQCPYLQNLIPILGDTDGDGRCDNALCDLQIEGTGSSPYDTVVDGDFSQLNGIRGDRADGLHLRNLTVQRFEFNAVYVLETDGFAFDEVVTRWNDEYGFLSFAVDHGLYQNCEGYGNGDSAIYPGSATDLNQDAGLFDDNTDLRLGTEIRGCRGHHNTLGYSGTAGNSVHTHHNEFDHNIAGAAMDSLFPDHPGLPQDHAYFHDNVFHGNNAPYYERDLQAGRCEGPFSGRDYDEGVVCPVVPLPVGTGLVLAGGNHNLYERNRFYDNWRQGGFQFFVPAALRGEMDPLLQFDTSNYNTWRDNVMGTNRNGTVQPNGTDLVWDGEGEGNCWEGNTGPEGAVTTGVGDGSGTFVLPGAPLPTCDMRSPVLLPGPGIAAAAGCAQYNRSDNPNPEGCNWFSTPTPPAGRMPEGPTIERIAGDERVGTALAVSQDAFPGASANVVIATSERFADALAGAPLAAHLEAPLLITPSGGLDERVAEEIRRLGATNAWLLGGTVALGDRVEADLAALGLATTRIGGGDRYETAARIAQAIGSGNAFLVEGEDFASALAASAVGALVGRPVLLTAADAVPPSLEAFLADGAVVDVRVVGTAVSDAVMARLPEIDAVISDVERTAGADALETSVAMAELGIQIGQDDTDLWVTTVENWPDALGAAAAAAVDEGVLVQVPADGLGAPATALVERLSDRAEFIRVVGGEAALAPAVVEQLVAATGGVEGDVRGDRSHGTYRSTGRIAPLSTAPAAYEGVTGTATMVRTVQGTTEVELQVRGMPPGTVAPVHVHVGSCTDDAGGDHFQFTPDGGTMPPNEIHPSFVSDAAGVGRGTATAFAIAGPDARSVVIHTPEGEKVACADLTGADLPEGLATTPQLAAFMAPPAIAGDGLAHRLFADGQIWLVAAVVLWLGGSAWLRAAVRRRRRVVPAG